MIRFLVWLIKYFLLILCFCDDRVTKKGYQYSSKASSSKEEEEEVVDGTDEEEEDEEEEDEEDIGDVESKNQEESGSISSSSSSSSKFARLWMEEVGIEKEDAIRLLFILSFTILFALSLFSGFVLVWEREGCWRRWMKINWKRLD